MLRWMSGALVAASAACSARLGTSEPAAPTPSMAVPLLLMMALTSAKSTLMRPGTVMMSEMPCRGKREGEDGLPYAH